MRRTGRLAPSLTPAKRPALPVLSPTLAGRPATSLSRCRRQKVETRHAFEAMIPNRAFTSTQGNTWRSLGKSYMA